MIDYLFAFPDEATARADQIVGAYWRSGAAGNAGAWRGDCCIAPVQVWNPVDDIVTQQTDRGVTVNVTTRSYQQGFWLIVARPARDAALDGHAALELIADRDAADAGATPQQFIVYSKQPLANALALRLQPVFAGANYFSA